MRPMVFSRYEYICDDMNTSSSSPKNMKVPEDFSPSRKNANEDEADEFLEWIDPDAPIRYYPEFFRQELIRPEIGVKHFVTDER